MFRATGRDISSGTRWKAPQRRFQTLPQSEHNIRRHSEGKGVFPYPPSDKDLYVRQIVEQWRDRQTLETLGVAEAGQETLSFGNTELPAWDKKQEIIETVRNNQVTIILGETGSGKSTQIPQFLLEAGFDRITLTQPRIMAANGVAQRMQDELQQSFDGEDAARELVAVQTSEVNSLTERSRIIVRTDGLEHLLQLERYFSRLPQDKANKEASNTVLIIDEVHEFNVNVEVMLAEVKQLVRQYPQMRVVIMSATMDSEKLAEYFTESTGKLSPIVEIEGKPHDVTWHERPDMDVVGIAKELLSGEGDVQLGEGDDVLVFVQGKRQIADVIAKLSSAFADSDVPVSFLPLHAKQMKKEQDRIYDPHTGIRFIVATPVAMTSMTFEYAKVVIDSGLVNRIELDDEATEGLVTRACSQDDCRQRAGRVGRVAPGHYFLTRPNSEKEFTSFDEREVHSPPPILSTDLSRNVLQLACFDVDFGDLDFFHQISSKAIREAKDKLYNLGALDEDGEVTDIGKNMNKFSLSTEYARMMAEAMKPGVPGTVVGYVALVASAYEAGGLRDFSGKKQNESWRKLLRNPGSDAEMELQLFLRAGIDEGNETVLASYGYDIKNVYRARKAFRKICKQLGVPPQKMLLIAPSDDEKQLVEHCVAAGFVENIYIRDRHSEHHKYKYSSYGTSGGIKREVSERSIVHPPPPLVVGASRYYIDFSGEKVDIIENVSPITEERISLLGLRTVCEAAGHVVKGGMVKAIERQTYRGMKIGQSEVPIQWRQEAVEMVYEEVLKHPGPAQQELRKIKKELEHLQQLTPMRVGLLSQEKLLEYVSNAISRAQSGKFHEVDNALRELMVQEGISLDKYIAPSRKAAIEKAAVSSIEVGNSVFNISYQRGIPVVMRVPLEDIALLPDVIKIPDGREVKFRVPKLEYGAGRGKLKIARGHVDVSAREARSILQALDSAY